MGIAERKIAESLTEAQKVPMDVTAYPDVTDQ